MVRIPRTRDVEEVAERKFRAKFKQLAFRLDALAKRVAVLEKQASLEPAEFAVLEEEDNAKKISKLREKSKSPKQKTAKE